MFTFIYPESYDTKNSVDEDYAKEASLIQGFSNVCVLNKKSIPKNHTILYRGWMLKKDEYLEMEAIVKSKNSKLLVSLDDYYSAHHIDNWYDKMKDLTPETIILPRDGLHDSIKKISWDKFFVKDSVKSLTAKRGSIATSHDEIIEIVNLIEKYRGIEGSVVLRKVHNFVPETEMRFFSIYGKVYYPEDQISEIAEEVAKRVAYLPFISIDVIKDENGKEWLVEIGDGQVSDFKSWKIERFTDILTNIVIK